MDLCVQNERRTPCGPFAEGCVGHIHLNTVLNRPLIKLREQSSYFYVLLSGLRSTAYESS